MRMLPACFSRHVYMLYPLCSTSVGHCVLIRGSQCMVAKLVLAETLFQSGFCDHAQIQG